MAKPVRSKRTTSGKPPERLGEFVPARELSVETEEDESDYVPCGQAEVGTSYGGDSVPTDEMSTDESSEGEAEGHSYSLADSRAALAAALAGGKRKGRETLPALPRAPAPREPVPAPELPNSPAKRVRTEAPDVPEPSTDEARAHPLAELAPASPRHGPPAPRVGAYISLDPETMRHDPVGRRMARERLDTVAATENAATQLLKNALTITSTCIVNAEKSALDGPHKRGVRAMLRALLNADNSVTSVETRQAARQLIALDREMIAVMRVLEASLRTNPRLKNLAYERFLRENPCPICLDPFADPDAEMAKTVRFQCDHAIHAACLVKWCDAGIMGHTLFCPVCRTDEAPLDYRLEPWDVSGCGLDDAPETSDSESDTDGTFRARLPCDPAALARDHRVTRSAARANEREGANPFTPR